MVVDVSMLAVYENPLRSKSVSRPRVFGINREHPRLLPAPQSSLQVYILGIRAIALHSAHDAPLHALATLVVVFSLKG